jgi:hypothetical protein
MQQELQKKEDEFRLLEEEFEKEHKEIKTMARQIIKKLKKVSILLYNKIKMDPRSLYIFDAELRFRKLVIALSQSK